MEIGEQQIQNAAHVMRIAIALHIKRWKHEQKHQQQHNYGSVDFMLYYCCLVILICSLSLSVFIFHFFLSVGAREFVAVIIYLDFINIFSFFCYFCRFGWLIYWITI